jgi:hypothetical protein
MCRFLYLFDGKQEAEAEEKLEFNDETEEVKGKAEVASNITTNAAAASATPSQKYAVENTSLPLPVLSVYLFARGCLLHEPYEVIYTLHTSNSNSYSNSNIYDYHSN